MLALISSSELQFVCRSCVRFVHVYVLFMFMFCSCSVCFVHVLFMYVLFMFCSCICIVHVLEKSTHICMLELKSKLETRFKIFDS